jgi:hypothetical protein
MLGRRRNAARHHSGRVFGRPGRQLGPHRSETDLIKPR